eukprot:gene9989-biopygen2217
MSQTMGNYTVGAAKLGKPRAPRGHRPSKTHTEAALIFFAWLLIVLVYGVVRVTVTSVRVAEHTRNSRRCDRRLRLAGAEGSSRPPPQRTRSGKEVVVRFAMADSGRAASPATGDVAAASGKVKRSDAHRMV